MKRLLYLVLILSLGNVGHSSAQTNAAIQRFASLPQLKHAKVGYCVKDMSGKIVAQYNDADALTPASALKLFTTATALELLGDDYRYKTTLEKDKSQPQHLLVRGAGDPTLGTAHLDNDPHAFLNEWVARIKANFDTTQVLDITIIDDLFGYDGVSERWIRQDLGNYYAAGAYGVSVYDNTYKLTFNTQQRDTCPVILSTDPQMNISFTNRMQLNTSGDDNGYIWGQPFSDERTLVGDVPAGRKAFSIKGDIPDPGGCLAALLAKELLNANVKVGEVKTSREAYYQHLGRPEGAVFYTHQSPPLSDIVRDVNVRSNNHYAEHLIRTIGRNANGDIYSSALKEGIAQVDKLWRGRGFDTDALFMYDGCGLAPSNAISAGLFCDMLVYMHSKSKETDAFVRSFPRAGVSGTVKSLLRGTRLAGKVYAKSGTIVNVRSYAGYYIEGDRKYAFAIIVNNYTGSRSDVVKGIERLLLSTLK